MEKQINYINFNNKRNPDVVSLMNRLAHFEKRKAHDVAKRLLLDSGMALLKQYDPNAALPKVG